MQKSELMFWEECETAEQDDERSVVSRGIPLTPSRLDASQRTSSDASLSYFRTSLFPAETLRPNRLTEAYALVGDRCHGTWARKKIAIGNRENARSGIRKAFNPIQGPDDVGMASEITLAGRNAENVAGTLVSDGAPDAFREKSKLLF